MEIERVNDNTVKFFISYRDIEDRGFDREEIWYDRERSEELFWEMMDEANDREGFSMDGPLWIQVQAYDKGLEIIVTKAQLSKDGSKLELPIADDKYVDIPVDDSIEKMFEQQLILNDDLDDSERDSTDSTSSKTKEFRKILVAFADIEDVIRLSHHLDRKDLTTELYVMDDHYYLYVVFHEDATKDEIKNTMSQLLEFGSRTNVTIFRLQEYGKRLIEHPALSKVRSYFTNG